jgi:ribonuclease P protein component
VSQRRHTLPKAEKLKGRKQIEALFAEGKAFTLFPIRVVYRLEPGPAQADGPTPTEATAFPRVGVSVSARHFKKAVHRNRIKRLLRESYRLQKQILPNAGLAQGLQLAVFFLFVGKELPSYHLINEKMCQCLQRLAKQMKERQ